MEEKTFSACSWFYASILLNCMRKKTNAALNEEFVFVCLFV